MSLAPCFTQACSSLSMRMDMPGPLAPERRIAEQIRSAEKKRAHQDHGALSPSAPGRVNWLMNLATRTRPAPMDRHRSARGLGSPGYACSGSRPKWKTDKKECLFCREVAR